MAGNDGSVEIDVGLNTDGVDGDVKTLQTKLQGIGDSMKSTGESMTTYLTTSLTAIGASAIMVASDVDSAGVKLQNQLGLTNDELDAMMDNAKNIYKDGFGESLQEVTDSMHKVKQNMQELTGEELETATKSAMTLAQTFDADVNEVSRAGQNLMKNFGLESEEAFDLMAKGAQNGLNYSDEMFDNLSEYAPLWNDMGYSAEEMFGILSSGAEQGVYNLDYLNDVMKEFQIRATDGSKGTAEAVAELGPEVEKVWGAFSKGEATVADMADIATKELSKIDDKVKQNELGVALFGTKWEDLGGDVVLSMLQAGESLEGFDGAMGDMVENQEQSFGQRLQAMWRELTLSLEPLGRALLDIAEVVMPLISGAVSVLSGAMNAVPAPIMAVVAIIGGLVALAGPVLLFVGSMVSAFSGLTGVLGTITSVMGMASKAFGILKIALAVLSGPVGIAIAVITGLVAVGVLIYKNWEQVSAFLGTIWEGIKTIASTVFTAIGALITMIWDGIKLYFTTMFTIFQTIFTAGFEIIKTIISTVLEGIRLVITTVWEGIKTYFTTVFNIYKTIFTTAWNAIKTVTTTVFNAIFTLIKSIWDKIKATFTTVTNTIKSILSTAFNAIKTTVSTVMNNIWSTIKSIWDKITGFLKGINLLQIGKNIIDGLIKGIKSKVDAVVSSVKDIGSKITSKLKGVLGIHSPSKVMQDEVGQWIPLGIETGIAKTLPALAKTAGNMAGGIAGQAIDSTKKAIPKLKASVADMYRQQREAKEAEEAKLKAGQVPEDQMATGAKPVLATGGATLPTVAGAGIVDSVANASADKQGCCCTQNTGMLGTQGNTEYVFDISIPLDSAVLAKKTVRYMARELLALQNKSKRGG